MRAVVFTKYGSADVLELRDVEKPAPRDDEVLVRVHAVSINDWDWGALGGDLVNRFLFGLLKPKKDKQILGSDIAGRVEAVGEKVRQFQPGDEVYGDLSGRWGGFAEYVCAPESMLTKKPPAMSFEDAAAIPQAAALALQGLRDAGRIQRGQRVLINGGGGGAGTFAIQLAKLYDAEITAVDSGAKLDMMRELGAHHVIDYQREDFTRSGRRYDLVLDVKMTRSIFTASRALSRHGTYSILGGSGARLLPALLSWPWLAFVHRKYVRIVVLKTNKDLAFINELYEAGKLRPVIDGPYALEQLRQAFRMFGEGKHKGKIVISLLR